MLRGPAFLLILLCALPASAEMPHEGTTPTEICRTVKTGAHESTPYTLPGFVDAAERSIDVRFLPNAADYACGCAVEPVDSCNTSSWNKLWGSSRCGYTHSHHQDSDRFVWRRAVVAGQIEIATYSYDGGKKPYSPPDPHLLQPFSTLLATNVSYQLRMHVGAVNTSFVLGRAGATLETKVNQHANACAKATMGYKLGFFFGGQCSAPQPVTACYSEQPKQ